MNRRRPNRIEQEQKRRARNPKVSAEDRKAMIRAERAYKAAMVLNFQYQP